MQILFPFSVIYKNRRGYPPRRFSLFLSRASLREFSFLALSRDIIPLDCVFFRGILSRFYFLFFQGNSIARPRICYKNDNSSCVYRLFFVILQPQSYSRWHQQRKKTVTYSIKGVY